MNYGSLFVDGPELVLFRGPTALVVLAEGRGLTLERGDLVDVGEECCEWYAVATVLPLADCYGHYRYELVAVVLVEPGQVEFPGDRSADTLD